MEEPQNTPGRGRWFVFPPVLYFVLSLILIRFRAEHALEFISYPGSFLSFLAGIHGHGGYELVVFPNLILHALLGGLSFYMGTPAKRFGLYFSCLLLLGALASVAGALINSEGRQSGAYSSAQRTWRKRIPSQRKMLAEEDFAMGVKMWETFCVSNIKLEDRLPRPGIVHCPDVSASFKSAAELSAPEQSGIRCLSQLYLATFYAISAKATSAQEAFGKWKDCAEAPHTENAIALEGIYAKYLPNAIKIENLERKAHEQWLRN